MKYLSVERMVRTIPNKYGTTPAFMRFCGSSSLQVIFRFLRLPSLPSPPSIPLEFIRTSQSAGQHRGAGNGKGLRGSAQPPEHITELEKRNQVTSCCEGWELDGKGFYLLVNFQFLAEVGYTGFTSVKSEENHEKEGNSRNVIDLELEHPLSPHLTCI